MRSRAGRLPIVNFAQEWWLVETQADNTCLVSRPFDLDIFVTISSFATTICSQVWLILSFRIRLILMRLFAGNS